MAHPKSYWVSIIIFFFIIAFVIVFIPFAINTNTEIENQTSVWQKLISPKPAQDEDLGNWQTYRNEDYGFQVNYPDDYVERKEDLANASEDYIDIIVKHYWKWDDEEIKDYIEHEITRIADGSLQIDIKKYDKNDLEKNIIMGSINDMELLNKNGVNYYSISHPKSENISFYAIRSERDDNLFIIIETSKSFVEVQDKMLSTFKFIEPTRLIGSGCKSKESISYFRDDFNLADSNATIDYLNKEKGISFKIPFNREWGNPECTVMPYFEDKYGSIWFGKPNAWGPDEFKLYFEKPRSLDDVINNINEVSGREPFLYSQPEKKTLNNITYIEWTEYGMIGLKIIEIKGNKQNYIFETAEENINSLENIIKTINFID